MSVMDMYVPFFLVFFLSNSLRVNGAMRVEGQPEWKGLLLAGIANSAGLLLRLPAFSPVVRPLPPALPRPRNRGRVVFWAVFVFGAVVARLSYIPMSELSQRLFVAASNREPTWFFPQRMNNAVMLWAVLNGLLTNTVCYLPL